MYLAVETGYLFTEVGSYDIIFPEIDLKAEQETIKNYRERIRQAERSGEFALFEALRDIIKQEQDHEIDLKDARFRMIIS
jgi:bacterioferritin (cytochrome b1)